MLFYIAGKKSAKGKPLTNFALKFNNFVAKICLSALKSQ